MSEQTKHAELPWILGGCSGRMITTPDGYIGDGFIADVDTLANAAFIIRAVNSYDAMREACEWIKWLGEQSEFRKWVEQTDWGDPEAIVGKATAALALAKGEQT